MKEKFEGLGYSKKGENSWLENSTEEVPYVFHQRWENFS